MSYKIKMKKSSGISKIGLVLSSVLFLMAFPPSAHAQSSEIKGTAEKAITQLIGSDSSLKRVLKLNSLAFVGIVNPAMEFKLNEKLTLQGEVLMSFYFKEFLGSGKPFAAGLVFCEGRYYPRRAMSGFFFGPVVGGGAYKLNKGIYPLYKDQYKGDSYQQGWNMMLGLSVGYQFSFSERWGLELCWGGGYQHSWYRGYKRKKKDEPYHMYVDWNKDAEFLPFFKGGVMVTYKF